MTDKLSKKDRVSKWPDCDAGQIQVLLLGTYHMDNPGLDEVNVSADDVLSPERQRELDGFVQRFTDWNPDVIAVERPHDRHDEVHEIYREYRDGKRKFDREVEIEPPHSYRDSQTSECRSEVVQIGFRLATILNHETVFPVDSPMDLSNSDYEQLENEGFTPNKKSSVALPDADIRQRKQDTKLAQSTITEFHRWLNQAEQQRFNHDSLFGEYIRWGAEENFGGPQLLTRWYERNLRIVHNLWRIISPDTQRIFLLMGNGHIRVLRHLLTETPQFCPISPRPYLTS